MDTVKYRDLTDFTIRLNEHEEAQGVVVHCKVNGRPFNLFVGTEEAGRQLVEAWFALLDENGDTPE
jgi:hypothetical protein